MVLRQRLKACLTAIHCFHEARLDDECAFYTSRALPPGPSRVCTNPVATLLEWQDALVSLPSTAACACTANLWEVGSGTGGQPGLIYRSQWGRVGSVQGWLGYDKVFSVSSVLFQLVLLPLRTLHHEASAAHCCPALLLCFSPIYCRSTGLGADTLLSFNKVSKVSKCLFPSGLT